MCSYKNCLQHTISVQNFRIQAIPATVVCSYKSCLQHRISVQNFRISAVPATGRHGILQCVGGGAVRALGVAPVDGGGLDLPHVVARDVRVVGVHYSRVRDLLLELDYRPGRVDRHTCTRTHGC